VQHPCNLHVVELTSQLPHEQERVKISAHWDQCIERAEYEAHLARQRYEQVDPANRLVASELERRWNESLEAVSSVRQQAAEQAGKLPRDLSDEDTERVRRMAENIDPIWAEPTTTERDRKRLLRAAIERVVITGADASVRVQVEWKGGEITELSERRSRRGYRGVVTDAEVVELESPLSRGHEPPGNTAPGRPEVGPRPGFRGLAWS